MFKQMEKNISSKVLSLRDYNADFLFLACLLLVSLPICAFVIFSFYLACFAHRSCNIVRQEQQQADNMVVIATLLLLLCLNINQATAASATRFPDTKSSTTPSPTKSASTGTTASCQAALRECALFSVDEASLDNVYQQAFSAMLQKQRLEYQHNLVKARDFLINLMNLFILNPDLPPDSRSCQGADSTPVTILNDPTATLPKVDSVPDITVRKVNK